MKAPPDRNFCLTAPCVRIFDILGFEEFARFVARHNALNSFVGIQQITDGGIVIQCVDDIGDIFTHIAVDVPFAL